MRFLVDECLPTRVASQRCLHGHDAMHVADLGLCGAPDEQVMGAAAAQRRVLISADTDFGELLAIGKLVARSVILLRGAVTTADHRLRLVSNLDQIGTELDAGAIVVLTDQRIRIRLLPIVR